MDRAEYSVNLQRERFAERRGVLSVCGELQEQAREQRKHEPGKIQVTVTKDDHGVRL
jgi:uncharacterized protein YfcZ (UPF0381/DUF406 family)